MHAHAAQALKNDDKFNMDGTKAQALAATIHAVKLAIVKEQPMKLHSKEVVCCMSATD